VVDHLYSKKTAKVLCDLDFLRATASVEIGSTLVVSLIPRNKACEDRTHKLLYWAWTGKGLTLKSQERSDLEESVYSVKWKYSCSVRGSDGVE